MSDNAEGTFTPPNGEEPISSSSFAEKYARLQEIKDIIQAQEEPDLDVLLPLVKEASELYGFCQARIEAAQVELTEIKQKVNASANAASASKEG